MAHFLYRLGRRSARYPWRVLGAWLAVLLLAGAGYLVAGGNLATTFSIPGTATDRVTSQLEYQFPDLAGMNASVVFTTDDGQPFTDTQRQEIVAELDTIESIDGVAQVISPWFTGSERDKQAQALERGTDQLVEAEAELDQAQAQLDEALSELRAEQRALNRQISRADDPDAFADRQAQLDQTAAALQAQQKTLDQGKQSITQGKQEIALGTQLLEYSAGITSISEDRATGLATILFDQSMTDLPQEVKNDVAQALEQIDIDGVTVDYSVELASDVSGLIGPGEVAGLMVAAAVLLITLTSLLATILPLISSLIGVGIGVAGSMAFSGLVDMTSVTPALGVMLGLAVGIDYALFIINRHRRQYHVGMDLHESIGLANGTAGNAVVFAGSTVIVALLALNLTGIPFLGVMGSVGAVCVAVAVVVAITMIPALLSLIGPRVFGRKARTSIGAEERREKPVRPMPAWQAVLSIVIPVAALLILAIPAASMRLGLPDGSAQPQDSTAYRTYATVAEEFGAGQNGPLVVVARTPQPVPEDDALMFQADIAELLMAQDDVVAAAPIAVNDSRYYFVFQVIPRDGPASESTEQLVNDLRDVTAARRCPVRRRRTSHGEHRHLQQAVRRLACVPRGGGGPHADPVDNRVPLAAGAIDRRRGLHPVVPRRDGCGGGRLPVGMAGCGVRCPSAGARVELRADHRARSFVRACDGLPTVHRLGDAGGARARCSCPARGGSWCAGRAEGGHRRGSHHDLRVRRLRVLPLGSGASHRLRSGDRSAHRRVRRAARADAGRDARRGQCGVVASRLARPTAPQRGHRGHRLGARASTARPTRSDLDSPRPTEATPAPASCRCWRR